MDLTPTVPMIITSHHDNSQLAQHQRSGATDFATVDLFGSVWWSCLDFFTSLHDFVAVVSLGQRMATLNSVHLCVVSNRRTNMGHEDCETVDARVLGTFASTGCCSAQSCSQIIGR
jgi:hypothetical protein